MSESPSTDPYTAAMAAPGWLALLLAIPAAWWTARMTLSADPWCFMDYLNLAFHEAGHIFFSPLGSTLHILGGTLAQLLVPGGLIAWFLLREGRPLGASFCCWWVGESLVNVARYMADARDLELPLVGGGDHDWNELFYRFGLLTEPAVARTAGLTRGLGVLIMLAGLAWMARLGLRARSLPSGGYSGAVSAARRSP